MDTTRRTLLLTSGRATTDWTASASKCAPVEVMAARAGASGRPLAGGGWSGYLRSREWFYTSLLV